MAKINENIDLGILIRDRVFQGNSYAEKAYLREDGWANDVIIDKIRSIVDVSYTRIYTDEDLTKADLLKEEVRLINQKVVDMLPNEE